MPKIALPRFTFWRGVLLVILALGSYSTIIRFTQGLAGATNLTDEFPWGLWVGFDILCGVALAAGGFTISAGVFPAKPTGQRQDGRFWPCRTAIAYLPPLAIQRSILASSTAIGSAPVISTWRWKPLISNFGPSAACALARSRLMVSWPIL